MPPAGKRSNGIAHTGAADNEHKYESATKAVNCNPRIQFPDNILHRRLEYGHRDSVLFVAACRLEYAVPGDETMSTYGFMRLFAAFVAFTFANSLCLADTPEVREDCLGFNLDSASVAFIQGSWKIVDGSHWIFDFGNQEQQARRALDIIHYYRMDATCFAGRPHAPMAYLLSAGRAPVGTMPAEQCESFDPGGISLRQTGEFWSILSGTQVLFEFGNREYGAKQPNRVPTVFDQDHEFDGGSRITLTSLSNTQIKNLAMLAKVWGFLKYHHPAVTSGKRHWDYDLFRIIPSVLAAADRAAANRAISDWIATLGNVAECTVCATLDSSDLYLGTNLNWLSDQSLLGPDLSQTLRSIYRNRTRAATTFFVSLAPGVLNPVFDNELSYRGLKLPDAGYQLLGLFRFWNMVQYFYPNRDVMADDPATSPNYWDSVLEESIAGIALATGSLTYQQELMTFIAKIHDTHANLWSSLAARSPIGNCQLPVDVRFVEGVPLVLRNTLAMADSDSGLQPGDVIEQLDGVAVGDLVTQWRPIYADSNEAARLRDIGLYMTRGDCGPAAVSALRGDEIPSLMATRVPIGTLDFSASYTHDLPGDTFQMLSNDIAYLKLSSVQASKSASYVQSAAGTKGLIIDIRNYPSEFVVFSLGSLLVSEPTDFVRFTNGDVTNPGAFHWTPPLGLNPQQPHYAGKVVLLVDEVTQSQAEYTTMAFARRPG